MRSVQQIIDNAIALGNQQREEGRTPSGLYSPSLLGRCFRAQFYKRKGAVVTNPPDARTMRVFTVGHIFHDWVQKLIPGEHEVEVKTDHFRGFADTVLEDEVVDFKTVHSRQFFHMNKKGFDINVDKLPNILQVVFYALHLRKNRARLVFLDKDSLCISEYGFFVEKWQKALNEEMDILIKNWESGTLPEAEPRAYSGKECKFCSYQDKCKQDGGKVWTKNNEILQKS